MATSLMARPVPATRSRPAVAAFETATGVEALSSFDRMGLSDDVLRGIYGHGFDKPSAIQQRAVVPIVQGRDVIAQAQSGTGKTSTFALASCQIVDTSTRDVQVLILSPTSDLASQTERVVLAIGYYRNVLAHACVGGKSMGEDIRKLETDEMLSRGFKDQIYDVYRFLPPELQVVLVSVTFPTKILEMTGRFMTDPIGIVVKRDELMLERVDQYMVPVEREDWKFYTLCDLYDNCPISQGVVFCNTKRKVEWLAEKDA
ncbi:hypothetical protein EUGRSUZ_E01187 [Eucalyptus grandis]|uniref:Uncharacterized protein n=2 Tax=Eucalyptus grandis TaxID=71139 RepID=A0ACC3KTQ8_EUCGR|nr:hypothetical protein EUGRSUZ_E01187 [Eucalyptus grandis]